MNDKSFSEPIRLRIANTNERVVSTVFEGLEFLTEWPAERDQAYRAAERACRDALDGITPAKRASRALRNAAEKAELLASLDPGTEEAAP